MLIKIKLITGLKLKIDVEPTDTGLNIKEKIEKVQGIPVHQQKLQFSAKEVKDDKTVEHYKIKEGSKLHLLMALV